jgi:hypothetical protein
MKHRKKRKQNNPQLVIELHQDANLYDSGTSNNTGISKVKTKFGKKFGPDQKQI